MKTTRLAVVVCVVMLLFSSPCSADEPKTEDFIQRIPLYVYKATYKEWDARAELLLSAIAGRKGEEVKRCTIELSDKNIHILKQGKSIVAYDDQGSIYASRNEEDRRIELVKHVDLGLRRNVFDVPDLKDVNAITAITCINDIAKLLGLNIGEQTLLLPVSCEELENAEYRHFKITGQKSELKTRGEFYYFVVPLMADEYYQLNESPKALSDGIPHSYNGSKLQAICDKDGIAFLFVENALCVEAEHEKVAEFSQVQQVNEIIKIVNDLQAVYHASSLNEVSKTALQYTPKKEKDMCFSLEPVWNIYCFDKLLYRIDAYTGAVLYSQYDVNSYDK